MSKTIPVRLDVLRSDDLSPSLRRVILGGRGFEEFASRVDALDDYTDTYVKLLFWPRGQQPDGQVDLSALPADARPAMRTYTVRWVDRAQHEMAIDFVVHGDEGLAGPWARDAQPGDSIYLRGPAGGYAPDPTADWHLIVGDEAAIPAIAAAVEALADDARATVLIEVDGPADELDLPAGAGVEVRWLHRGSAERGTTSLLCDAVRELSWPSGRVQVFVHGESGLLKTVRPFLLNDRQVARRDASISAYWRRGATEEGFRAWKAQQAEAVMRPEPSAGRVGARLDRL